MSRRSGETDTRRGTPSVLLGKAGGVPLLGLVFGTFLVPFCCKMRIKSTKRVTKRTIEISIDFLIDFLTILVPFRDTCWRPLGYFGP